ncbi:MAG: glycosyltransferase [Ignavibacteriaceae bacterium]|nr:glycosyltransferase [Ignavibacteriaceae bacterium]
MLQINAVVNSGSTGHIAEDIGKLLILKGHESYIAFGRGNRPSTSKIVRIGNVWDTRLHGIKTRLFDRHGFGSEKATLDLLEEIKNIQPDIIHLHNLHGYYLNVEILFNYLKKSQIPVVWTLHDCWPFTGHCTYFDNVNCFKWQNGCYNCPNKGAYPTSWFKDNSNLNYKQKKILFNSVPWISIVSPSQWLADHLSKSFLGGYPISMIRNGIDLGIFYPHNSESIKAKIGIGKKFMLLGVASVWDKRKGLEDFIKLNELISNDMTIVLVGLSQKQLKSLPKSMIGIARTENIEELTEFYSAADVFLNPTWVDNCPITNSEALACGTPVVTYRTGGSPESINDQSGIVVQKGNIHSLYSAIMEIRAKGKSYYSKACIQRASELYNKDIKYQEYIDLYNSLIAD